MHSSPYAKFPVSTDWTLVIKLKSFERYPTGLVCIQSMHNSFNNFIFQAF